MTEKVKLPITRDNLTTDDWVEVINGQLREIDTNMMDFTHSLVIHNAYNHFKQFVQQNDLGYIPDNGLKYVLHANANGIQTVRIPDLAFLRKTRVPSIDYEQPFEGAPDFAIEVASPSQVSGVSIGALGDLLDKVADFLKYGTEEVWVIFPTHRQILRILQTDIPGDTFYDTDTITSTLFPGLVIKVADLFASIS